MKMFVKLILFVLCSGFLLGNDGAKLRNHFAILDSTEGNFTTANSSTKGLLEGRRLTAAIYSLVIPGSGQTTLGSPYKGFGFTFVAFGSALTTLISHNNYVASNERLDALEFQYKTATTWESSNLLYTSMQDTHTKLLRYKNMRNAFAIVSALVWTLNIADVLYNTEDEGEVIFSSISITNPPILIAGGVVDHQQRLNISIPLN